MEKEQSTKHLNYTKPCERKCIPHFSIVAPQNIRRLCSWSWLMSQNPDRVLSWFHLTAAAWRTRLGQEEEKISLKRRTLSPTHSVLQGFTKQLTTLVHSSALGNVSRIRVMNIMKCLNSLAPLWRISGWVSHKHRQNPYGSQGKKSGGCVLQVCWMSC